jgi:hypothetical protein
MGKRGHHPRHLEDSRDGSGPFWGHSEGLYDQDEDMYGEKYDLATGRAFNNSSHAYDNLDTASDVQAGEAGFNIIGNEYGDEEGEDAEIIDHWAQTQKGLARSAGIKPPLDESA